MKMILKIAWRNVWRNKRRTIITILAVFFAAYLSIVMRGMQKGVYKDTINNAVELFTGYMQIQHEDYNDKPSLRNSFKPDDELFNFLNNNEDIIAYSPRIDGNGLIGKNNSSIGTVITCIDPDMDSEVTTLKSKVTKGNFINNENPKEIVAGYKLLDNLNAEVGDSVVILATSYDGSMGNMKFVVGGSIKTGSPEMDKRTVIMHLNTGNELFAMYGKRTSVALSLSSVDVISEVQKDVSNKLKGTELNVLDWAELMPSLKQSIELDDASGMIYLMFLIIIVAFGIMNTITMSVTERYKEFGVMLALGAKHVFLVVTLFFEILFITILGILIGNGIGFLTNYYFKYNPVVIEGDLAELYQQFGFTPTIATAVNFEIFWSVSLTVLAVAVIVYFLSAYKLFRLEALKGIRHT